MGLVILLTNGYSVHLFQDNFSIIALRGNLSFSAIQALLARRLVRKNYRSFCLYVVRDDGSKSRDLSMREAVSVWLWILWPQFAFLLLVSVVVWFWGAQLPLETVRGFLSMSLRIRFLVVGPYAVGLALRPQYAAFRLEAHGVRYA